MVHHLEVVNEVPTNLVATGAILKPETKKLTQLVTYEVEKIEDKMAEQDTTRVVDVGDFKISVTSVGTLDMKKFIEVAMSLPSFWK